MAGGVRAFDRARLVELRRVSGLSQSELARRAGVAQPNLSGIERGLRLPTPRMIARLAVALGCRTDELVRPARSPTLADLRRRAGLLQRDVAASLDLPPSTYSAVEQGHRQLPETMFRQLARVLAVSESTLTTALKAGREDRPL